MMSPPFCTVSLMTAKAALQIANSANISTPYDNKGSLEQPPHNHDADGNFNFHAKAQIKTLTQ
jgi:hypothetical protein